VEVLSEGLAGGSDWLAEKSVLEVCLFFCDLNII
jgi:hypothetical protein